MVSHTGNDPIPLDSAERCRQARLVALDVLGRRERGEPIADADVLRANAHLLPELVDELQSAAVIRAARVTASKSSAQLRPLSILSDAELDAPIDAEIASPSAELRPADLAQGASIPELAVAVAGFGIFQEVGRGGQGGVFRAIQESTGRAVALKVLSGGVLAASRHRARFDREAKILAALDHPNIVSIVDRVRTLDGSDCLVMEYIDGLDLDSYWIRCIPRGPEGTVAIVRLFQKLCMAVQEAHARGIVHRDLKPSNVRVDARGEAHVLDFGLASAASLATGTSRTVTTTGQLIGSLPWTSPEQSAGMSDEVDASADVYSIGVMLYQALAGRFPYDVEGPIRSVLDNIAREVPAPPSAVNRSRVISRKLDAVVLKSLAKRREDRYAFAGDLARDLGHVLAGRRVSASSVVARNAPRRAVAAILLLALGTGASFTIARWAQPSNPVSVIPLPSQTNSLGMRFIRVSPGLFQMGDPPRPGTGGSGNAVHSMVIDHYFYLGATEVTQQQYQRIMGTNPSDPAARGPNLPVQQVTFEEAAEFCRRLSALDGRKYRLPNETEWEFACRAGTTGDYAGDGHLDELGWYAGNAGGAPHPVGGKSPNQWGLLDMYGNVAEWCEAGNLPPTWPKLGSEWHVSKGGSFQEVPEKCRSGWREIQAKNTRRVDIGFRVLLEDPTPVPAIRSTSATAAMSCPLP